MKNLKNTLAALALFVMLVFGTTSANAGLLMSDRSAPAQEGTPCASSEATDILTQATGIILAGFTGIILHGRDGLLKSDRNTTTCDGDQRTGILMSD